MTLQRRHFSISGFVQGVGFRPYVYRLAKEYHLTGWVLNNCDGVEIEVQGSERAVIQFQNCLERCSLENATILECRTSVIPPVDEESFVIKDSESSVNNDCLILPDLAVCKECLGDVMEENNRRYRYPFTNCTNCGPRFSIIEKLPYDRENTAMEQFAMCSDCLAEYHCPEDRRFHAQPNACPNCGPHLELWDAKGRVVSTKDDALKEACSLVEKGSILAVKGIGGFHLIADAHNDRSIEVLRKRKRRSHKPFALMYSGIEAVKADCFVSQHEENLLCSNAAPIVLLRARRELSKWIAPNNPYYGVMLAYSPLHFLMLQEFDSPLIATSGNMSDEPICIDENEALRGLNGIADYFLVHNRPILRRVDDSVVRVIDGKTMVLRRSRGLSSVPIMLKNPLPQSLALGGHQKSTIAIASGKRMIVSQHLGELSTETACDAFLNELNDMMGLYLVDPETVVTDMHPDYFSTQIAERMNKPIIRCQHHEAHVYSCMAEKQLEPPLLGVSWDGTGYGLDGGVWGGEFFRVEEDLTMERVGTLRPFRLLCGEKAIREPRLVALALLYESFGEGLFSDGSLPLVGSFSLQELANYEKMLSKGFLSPLCSSVGRLFDGVASLLGIRQEVTFEGQAATELEFLSETSEEQSSYEFTFTAGVIDWVPMLLQILQDLDCSIPLNDIAGKFHNTLVEMMMAVADCEGYSQVVLSGGVFQNKVLTEKAIAALKMGGYTPITHENIPPNDGGISCGQLYSMQSRVTLCV